MRKWLQIEVKHDLGIGNHCGRSDEEFWTKMHVEDVDDLDGDVDIGSLIRI